MPTQGVSGTSAAVPVPTVLNGFTANDLLLCHIYVVWDTDFATSTDIVPPAGWTQVAQQSMDYGDGSGDRFAVFRRTSAGVEPGTYSFTWAETAFYTGRITVIRNVDPVTPIIDGGMIQSVDAAPISVDAPSVVTTVANQRIFCGYAARGSQIWTIPASMLSESQLADQPALAGTAPDIAAGGFAAGAMCVTMEVVASAGATGTRTATTNPSLAPPNGIGLGHTLAINPAP